MTKLFTDEELLDDNEEVIIPDEEPLKPFLEKYKDDKGVAKALVEKDKFIKRLQRENAEVRASRLNEENVAEIVDRLLKDNNKTVPNPPVETHPAGQQNGENTQQASGISIQDVEKLLEKKEQSVREEQNLKYSKQELEKAYGADWVKVIQKRAKEIGESVEFFDTLAKTKPNVLLSLLSQKEQVKAQPSLFSNTVNNTAQTLGATQSGERTMKWYKDLQKSNSVLYSTPKIQQQMHQDALRLRESFFDV